MILLAMSVSNFRRGLASGAASLNLAAAKISRRFSDLDSEIRRRSCYKLTSAQFPYIVLS